MKSIFSNLLILLIVVSTGASAQNSPTQKEKVVLITGARFAYPLVQKWIDHYSTINPDVQILIESRGTTDPSQYDILIEAYEHTDEVKRNREYVYFARYAILPVANNRSEFAKTYGDKGLTKAFIKQLFFHDIYANQEEQKEVKEPYAIYTRLQKAGNPVIFAGYFGFEQKNIQGKSIAGSDEHLLKAVLRDSIGVSYLQVPLAYDRVSKKPIDGLTVLPVDFNGNGRINADEKFYGDLATVIERLESVSAKDINNIPVEHLHFSVDKRNVRVEAIEFLRWVIQNGQQDLHDFGYLTPDPSRFEKDKFEQFTSKRK